MTYQKGHPYYPRKPKQEGESSPSDTPKFPKRRTRATLSERIIADFADHFEKNGRNAIEIVYRENPDIYLKIAVSLVPKEFVIEAVSPFSDLSDDDLRAVVENVLEKLRRFKEVTPSPTLLIEHEHANGHAGD